MRAMFLALTLAAMCLPPSISSGEEPGVVGLWEVRYKDAVGQRYLDVLDLDADGTYTAYRKFPNPDRGRWRYSNSTISFRSDVDDRLSSDLPVAIDAEGGLTFTIIPPDIPAEAAAQFAKKVRMVRSPLKPNFGTLDAGGRRVPTGIGGLVAAVLQQDALPWRADALPTDVRLKPLPHGHYEIELTFQSPKMLEGLRLFISAYDIRRSTFEQSRASAENGLPPEILDLPLALLTARDAGIKGSLKKASLSVYKNFGPVWFLSFPGRGLYVSAETGKVINEDVTGYVADYNADWAQINAQWRKMFTRPSRHASSSSSWSSSSSSSYDSDDDSSSGSNSGTGLQNSWSSGDSGAYNRFQSGTPTADDCYRYGGC